MIRVGVIGEIRYVVLSRLWEKDSNQDFYNQLEAKAWLLAKFNPYNNAEPDCAMQHPLTGGPFLWKDLRRRMRNGRPIKIYELAE